MVCQSSPDEPMLGVAGNLQTPSGFDRGVSPPSDLTAVPNAGIGQAGIGPNFPSKRNAPFKRKASAPGPKKLNVEGKPPAQIINELYKKEGISDTYENDGWMFKCSLTVAGQVFDAVSTSKKKAKHDACLAALKSLRPDISEQLDGQDKENYFATDGIGSPSKMRKVDPVESSSSLKGLLSSLAQETNKKYKMEVSDVAEDGSDSKNRKFSAVLTFEGEGKTFTQTAEGTGVVHTMVIRQALKDVYNVPEENIINVIKRGQLTKLEKMPPFSALQVMCRTSSYSISSVAFEVITEGKMSNYQYSIAIANSEAVEVQIKGPTCKSKAQAKEGAAAEALMQIFQITLPERTHPAPLEAAAVEKEPSTQAVRQLYEMGSRQKPKVRPEFTDMGVEMNGAVKVFKFKCVVGGREFIGAGKNKKDAKNQAATQALDTIFNNRESDCVTVTSPSLLDTSEPFFSDDPTTVPMELSPITHSPSTTHISETSSTDDVVKMDASEQKQEKKEGNVAGRSANNARKEMNDPVEKEDNKQEDFEERSNKEDYYSQLSVETVENVEEDGGNTYEDAASCQMSVETVEEDEDVEEKINSVDDATCAFVRSQYEIICALNGITPSSDFACFVIWSILNNEIKLISIGSSTQAEKGKEDSCLEPIGRMFRLKPSLRLSIVTSQPVDIRFSAPKSAEQRLSVYGKDNLLECISEVPDDKEEPRVHSVVDKILKWCNLGVQGALLTTRLHPIIPSSILTMTRCPLPNQSYLHLLTSRVCPPPLPINVYSAKMDLPFAESHAHLWSHADAKMEVLSETGTTADGAASSCSKHSLYKAFLAATPRFPNRFYREAKNKAKHYVASKSVFNQEMVKAGLGQWKGVRGFGERFYG